MQHFRAKLMYNKDSFQAGIEEMVLRKSRRPEEAEEEKGRGGERESGRLRDSPLLPFFPSSASSAPLR